MHTMPSTVSILKGISTCTWPLGPARRTATAISLSGCLRRRDEAALATVCRERAAPRGAARREREHELLGVARAHVWIIAGVRIAPRMPVLEIEHGGAQRAGAAERREADDIGEQCHARGVSLRSVVAR